MLPFAAMPASLEQGQASEVCIGSESHARQEQGVDSNMLAESVA